MIDAERADARAEPGATREHSRSYATEEQTKLRVMQRRAQAVRISVSEY
jgi:hypothetical protein